MMSGAIHTFWKNNEWGNSHILEPWAGLSRGLLPSSMLSPKDKPPKLLPSL
jgi:hypothetical protein